jgi:hypothetical protein
MIMQSLVLESSIWESLMMLFWMRQLMAKQLFKNRGLDGRFDDDTIGQDDISVNVALL